MMDEHAHRKWGYHWICINVGGVTNPNEKKITQDLSPTLAELGAQGWEMVSAIPLESSGDTKYVTFYFKRLIA